MSWRTISERPGARLQGGAPAPDTLATTGTLLVEARVPAFPDTPQVLLDYRHTDGWVRTLSLVLHPDGRLVLSGSQGSAETSATARFPVSDCARTLRVLYTWDAPRRRGFLALELPGQEIWTRVPVAAPHAMPVADLERIAADEAASPAATLVAWADTVEPFGPMPGLGAGTPIHTAAGWKPIEEIQPGDLVQTSDRGFQPIRQVLRRETPAAGHFKPLMLTAPSFGLLGDVLVSPEQRMLIEGADAEYLFGVDAVLVETRHLAPLAGIWMDRHLKTVTYHQVIFEHHSCMSIAGAWGESQFLPAVPDGPRRLRGTALEGHGPSTLPAHTEAANPMLQPFEAVVLVSAIQSRSSSLMPVLERVFSSTRFTITAQ
jgi:hypothetical protein